MQLSSKKGSKNLTGLKSCFDCFPTFLFLSSFYFTYPTKLQPWLKQTLLSVSPLSSSDFRQGKANNVDCFHSEDMTANLKWSEPPSSKPPVFPKSIHSHSFLHMPLFLKHSGTFFQVLTLSRFIEKYRCNQKRISTSSTHPPTLVYTCSNNLYFPFFTV